MLYAPNNKILFPFSTFDSFIFSVFFSYFSFFTGQFTKKKLLKIRNLHGYIYIALFNCMLRVNNSDNLYGHQTKRGKIHFSNMW